MGQLKRLASPLVQSCSAITSIHRLEVVNRTACYIAENLGEPIQLEDISRAAGMSKFHLHRVFEENVGSTLGRYLGGVRLKAALQLLSAPETRTMSVLDVALQVGFEDASAFSRSFQRRYGLTPSALRQGNRFREFPLLSTSTGNAVLDRGVTVVSLPEFWAYGYEVGGLADRNFAKEAPEGFKQLWDTIRRHGIEGIRNELGLPTYSWVLRDEACRLLCGFRSSVRLHLGSTVQERWIRSGKWLQARHTGPYATRWQTWERLQLQQLRWGRPEDGRQPFEEEVQNEPTRLGQPCCDVYFPC
ncbi:MAG TPA: AraC family transcriptional regulator [Polyangiaceae bacterium]|nr:AraC family transcriptional regulator [Polyangiaceae bacterium]